MRDHHNSPGRSPVSRRVPAWQRDPEVPAWIDWPIRALALVLVVPVRLVWELAAAGGRLVYRHVLVPAAGALHRFLWCPLARLVTRYLWPGARWTLARLAWVVGRFVVAPLVWLVEHLVVAPLVWLANALRPVGRLLLRALVAVLRGIGRLVDAVARGLGWLLTVAYLYLLRPFGLALTWAWQAAHRFVLTPLWRVVVVVATAVHRYLLSPFGHAVAWLWRHTVAVCWRAVAGLWRATVPPAVRWVRANLTRPVAATVRAVLAALGLRAGSHRPPNAGSRRR